jgi:hypothetical protein
MLVLAFPAPTQAIPFTATCDYDANTALCSWSSGPIRGEAGVEHPDFVPKGEALFVISDSTLTLTLTYLNTDDPVVGLNQALSGLTWNINPGDEIPDLVGGGTVGLTPGSAVINIAGGSSLVGEPIVSFPGDDLSGQWAFEDDLNSDLLGSFGVAAVGGDLEFVGPDDFGSDDIIDPSKTLVSPSPNGGDFMIVPYTAHLNLDGFPSQGPYVQNSMVFEFGINATNGVAFNGDGNNGVLLANQIVDVTPIFGTAGAPPIPEPHSAVLFTIGGLIVGGAVRRARSA